MKDATPERVLLAQWYSNGDCLLATTLARQIKTDFPGCHLTWAISTRCRELLRGNPHVDAIWEIEQPTTGEIKDLHFATIVQWNHFEHEVRARQASGKFTQVFLTFSGSFRNLSLYDGTVRGLIFGAYPGPINVSLAPVLRLDKAEIENVRRFVGAHPEMTNCRRVALFECSPKSGQSAVNPEFALALSRRLLAEFDDLCIVLSSNLPVASADARIIDASQLTFRENAELTKHCTLLIGCSSGLTWLSTSDTAKSLPTVQIITSKAMFPNSLAIDHERRGLPTDHILEMDEPNLERAEACLKTVFREGFAAARAKFHQRISLANSYAVVGRVLLREGRYQQAVGYFLHVLRLEHRRLPVILRIARLALGHVRWLTLGLASALLHRPLRR